MTTRKDDETPGSILSQIFAQMDTMAQSLEQEQLPADSPVKIDMERLQEMRHRYNAAIDEFARTFR